MYPCVSIKKDCVTLNDSNVFTVFSKGNNPLVFLYNKKLVLPHCSHRTNAVSRQGDTFIFVLPKNVFSCLDLKMTKSK